METSFKNQDLVNKNYETTSNVEEKLRTDSNTGKINNENSTLLSSNDKIISNRQSREINHSKSKKELKVDQYLEENLIEGCYQLIPEEFEDLDYEDNIDKSKLSEVTVEEENLLTNKDNEITNKNSEIDEITNKNSEIDEIADSKLISSKKEMTIILESKENTEIKEIDEHKNSDISNEGNRISEEDLINSHNDVHKNEHIEQKKEELDEQKINFTDGSDKLSGKDIKTNKKNIEITKQLENLPQNNSNSNNIKEIIINTEEKPEPNSNDEQPINENSKKEDNQKATLGKDTSCEGAQEAFIKTNYNPEKELSVVVMHAGEMDDCRYLRDYLEMTKLTGELKINEQDSKGCTPLHFAVASKNINIVRCLLQFGANVNLCDCQGMTPLFWATGRYPNADVSTYLIEKGKASVHVTNKNGACSLHGAAYLGNIECVILLLKYGADPKCVDKSGMSPLDLATDEQVKGILENARRMNLQPDKDDTINKAACYSCRKDDVTLKRCAKCLINRYCSRGCQVTDWKKGHRVNCMGFVLAKPSKLHGLNLNMASNTVTILPFIDCLQALDKRIKREIFIVKTQLPLINSDNVEDVNKDIMVYNKDRTIVGFVSSDDHGYLLLRKKIIKDGYMGIKAFFFAEMAEFVKFDNWSLRIYPGQCASFQNW